MKLESNVKTITEVMANHKNVNTAPAQEAVDIQLEELGEGEFININEETKSIKMTQRNYISQNFTLKELSEICQTLKVEG